MARLVLTMSPKWVENDQWDELAGYRELVQNARDEEVVHGCAMEVVYWPKTETLLIKNAGATLERRSLLLGESSKRDDDVTIGQFGTGYKMAMLILARAGKKVTLQNGDETWDVGIEHSDEFEGDVLVVKTRKRKATADALTWSISPVPADVVEEVMSRALFLARTSKTESAETYELAEYADAIDCTEVLRDDWNSHGLKDRVLRDERFRGKVYVRGLYVFDLPGNLTEAKFGYDFDQLKLDEARQMADPWDFKWQLGQLMVKAAEADAEVRRQYVQMVKQGSEETGFVGAGAYVSHSKVAEALVEDVKQQHGDDVVIVKDDYDAERVRDVGLKAVVMTSGVWDLVKQAVPAASDVLNEFADKVKEWNPAVPDAAKARFSTLVRMFVMLNVGDVAGWLEEQASGGVIRLCIVEFFSQKRTAAFDRSTMMLRVSLRALGDTEVSMAEVLAHCIDALGCEFNARDIKARLLLAALSAYDPEGDMLDVDEDDGEWRPAVPPGPLTKYYE